MTVKEIRLKARAKINLTLDVTGKREDGYHLLETIMQTVADILESFDISTCSDDAVLSIHDLTHLTILIHSL